ncbi:hypothetical protein C2G38_2256835 [Gigaspora rosea]|uniref:Tetratricopeptide repeat protein n=1 Tax=Gigaspora rosea TaxID=44941 RepID=A0A397TQC1_9GLOM|nr:hypothetical protein C2G38_2256835 [Gigaspora rosea]
MDRYMELPKQLNDSLKIEPNNVDALGKHGAICRVMEDYEKALEDLNRAVKINMNNAFVLIHKIKKYDEPIKFESEDEWLWISSKKTFHDMEKYEESLADLNYLLENNYKVAWALRKQAIDDFNKSLEIMLNNAWSRKAYCFMEKYEEGISDLTPNNAWALRNRGEAFCKIGLYEKLLADLNKSLNFDPSSENGGAVYHKLGKYEEALVDLNSLLKFEPDQS